MISYSIKEGDVAGIIDNLEKWYNADMVSKTNLFQTFTHQITQFDVEAIITSSRVLFTEGNVTRVPSVFINGYPLPDIYSLSDIEYYLNEPEESKIGLN